MQVENKKYRNQGIHVISAIFTVQKGETKILLIQRKNEPYQNMWALVGGALYNDEDLDKGMEREIYEKTSLENIPLKMFRVFGDVHRSPVMRMVAICYIGMVDAEKVKVAKETLHTSNADWFPITEIPEMAYDHNRIVASALQTLKEEIVQTDILKALYPNGFTVPEIQKIYESILGKKFDRRNFRKKLLGLDIVYDTGEVIQFQGKKPAKVYKFKEQKKNKTIF